MTTTNKRYSITDINKMFNEHGEACLLASLLGNPTLYFDTKFQKAISFGINFIKSSEIHNNCKNTTKSLAPRT